MNKFIITLVISLVSFGSTASTKVSMKDGYVKVQRDGITKDYGRVRDVRERNGKVEVYTNKNYNTPAITINKNGNMRVQRDNSSSSSFECRYNCEVSDE